MDRQSLTAESIAEAVFEHVRAVAKERAPHVGLTTNVHDIGLDSLERMDITNRLEQQFRIRVPEETLLEIETCGEIVEAIQVQLDKPPAANAAASVGPEFTDFARTHEYVELQRAVRAVLDAGERNPFFTVHEAISNNTTTIGGRQLINFSGNNYLGMSGDPRVAEAAKRAIDQFGTSVSASRVVSGTRPIHVELEETIADLLGQEDAITFTSGHSTNLVVIGHLLRPGDLILHDELVHNSILVGALLSGATRRAFPHNDVQALDKLLGQLRHEYRKVMVIIEGVYSMDGDYPDVPRFVEVKRRHQAWLLMDEAHSIGTMGATGRGMKELYNLAPDDVDIWMGTLSKALGACGGYIAGQKPLIEYLKYTCPGVVFTIGLSPSSSAAALEALKILESDPGLVETLHASAAFFLKRVKQYGLNTGMSGGTAIIPVILGNSLHSLRASRMMHERGISVQPILHPAVEEAGARLRFFINTLHTEQQLAQTADTLAGVLSEIDPRYVTRR